MATNRECFFKHHFNNIILTFFRRKNNMATTKKESVIEIKPLNLVTTTVRIEGMTPLIVHAWSEKAKKEMLDAQMGKAKAKKKEPKNPVADFACACYWMDGVPGVAYDEWDEEIFEKYAENARYGFPAVAIKQAAISTAYREGYSKNKVSLQGSFFIKGEGEYQLVEIKGGKPTMREDNVVIGGMSRTADLRYRPQWESWYMDLDISYDANGNLSLSDIVNLINLSGFKCGIGEWRVEKGGNYGTYQVATN